MENYKYIFGPVPSRRLGLSLGISPIPKKYCNYSCVYCQIGRTNHLSNERKEFFPLIDIINEFKNYISQNENFDVITIVGEGEPTLYSNLGLLIKEIKKISSKPVAIITNSGLLYNEDLQNELLEADIVLPSLDSFDEDSFKKINRPYGKLEFKNVYNGLVSFSQKFKGELWLEIMILEGFNEDEKSLLKIKDLIKNINYSKIYINTAVRPPAENYIKPSSTESLNIASKILNGICISNLTEGKFCSNIKDNYEAILSIIRRHPMNQHEIKNFLVDRNCNNKEIENLFVKLKNNISVEILGYKGYYTYRFK